MLCESIRLYHPYSSRLFSVFIIDRSSSFLADTRINTASLALEDYFSSTYKLLMGASSSVAWQQTKILNQKPGDGEEAAMITNSSQKHSCQSPPHGNSFNISASSQLGENSAKLTYSRITALKNDLSDEVLIKFSKYECSCYRLGLSTEDTFILLMKKLDLFLETGIIDSKCDNFDADCSSRALREVDDNDDDDQTIVDRYDPSAIPSFTPSSKLAELIATSLD